MQAMNGSAVPFRSRTRLIGCTMAIVLALSALVFASTASAKPKPVTHTYLALGDSLAFGYSKQLFNENKPGEPPTAFENGYVNDYYKYMEPKHTGVQLTNDGCPGETSASLIGNGPIGAALHASPLAASEEAPCAYHNVEGYPLHNEYGSPTTSQLENALGTIAYDAGTGKEVSTITMNIGANDELAAVHGCETEVGTEFATPPYTSKYNEAPYEVGTTPAEAVEHCLNAHVHGLIETIVKNVEATLYAIRNGAAFGGVNYTGQICFQGGYDPYGSVFVAGHELLTNSLPLAIVINENVKTGVEAFGATFANPQPKFNPFGKHEPAKLQKYTNMANFTEFEGKHYGEPGADGPDIHPTPAGYKVLAQVMKAACPPAVE